MELQRDTVKIELVHIDEGWCGEYDANDPQDEQLLRFYVMHKVQDTWEDVDDASYCTLLPITLSDEEQQTVLDILMTRFYLPVTNKESVKKLGEEMSWVSIEDIQHFRLTNI
jgi:hypothetical protein